MTRRYARAKKNQRAADSTPLNTPATTTILSSIRLDGSCIYTTYQGGTTAERFESYLKSDLFPTLSPDDIVVMDNMRSHHAKVVKNFLDEKHIPTRLFKQAVSLSKQARAIEAALDGINPLNAGKKKEEALFMLKKWFPQMENFSGQLKKYKVTINDLLEENKKLEARAKASEQGKMKDRMERATLESELHNLRNFVDRIPPEVLAQVKRQQRHTVKER